MHRSEADLIASYLQPTSTYLEYGSGGSTTEFGRLVASVYSVEHDCEWHDVVAGRVADAGLMDKVRFRCVPPSITADTHHSPISGAVAAAAAAPRSPASRPWGLGSPFEHGSYAQFHSYVNAVDDLADDAASGGVPRFDAVLIDGRARVATALRVLPYLTPSSVVFVHDWGTRSHLYAPILRYYTPVARVAAVAGGDRSAGPVDEPQGLLVLRRSSYVTDAELPLPEAALHAPYHRDGVDYRDGALPPAVTLPERAWAAAVATACPAHWPLARSPASLVALVWSDVLRLGVLVVAAAAVRSAVRRGTTAAAARGGGTTPVGTPRRGRRVANGAIRSTQWVVGERPVATGEAGELAPPRLPGRSPAPPPSREATATSVRRAPRAIDDSSLPPDDGGAVARAAARRKQRGGSLSSVELEGKRF